MTNNFPTGYQTASKLSKAELEAMTIKELKPLLDGTVPSLYKYRKAELIDLILNYTRSERLAKKPATQPEPSAPTYSFPKDAELTTYYNEQSGIEYQVNDELDDCEPKPYHFVFLRDALSYLELDLDNDQFTDFAFKVANAIKRKPERMEKNGSYRVERGKYKVRVYRWDVLIPFIIKHFPNHQSERLDFYTSAIAENQS